MDMKQRYEELPDDIKQFMETEIPKFRKYNPVTLPSGVDIWDLYEDYIRELWDLYKNYRPTAKRTNFDNACEIADVHRRWSILCKTCRYNLETLHNADEGLFCSSEDFNSEYIEE